MTSEEAAGTETGFGGQLDLCCILFYYFLHRPFSKSLLNLLQYCSVSCFGFLGLETRGILASRPEMEPAPPTLEGEVLTTGPPRKSHFAGF